MKITIAASAWLLLATCTYGRQLQAPGDEIRGIIVESLFPNFEYDSAQNKWVVESYDSQYARVYYYRDQVLAQANYGCADPIISPPPNTYIIPVFRSCYHTFVFSGSSGRAVLFDSTDTRSSRVVDRDSLLAKQWAFSNDIDRMLKDNIHILLSSRENDDGDIEELYSLADKQDTSRKGTVLLVFSRHKLAGIRYSMAKELEERRGMKLIRTFTVSDEQYLASDKTYIGRAEDPITIREIKITNKDELLSMFAYARAALE